MPDFGKVIGCITCAWLVVACAKQDTEHGAVPPSEMLDADSAGTVRSAGNTGSTVTAGSAAKDQAHADSENSPKLKAGLLQEDDNMVFRTEEFTLEAGDERYLCWAVRVPEDFKVSAYTYPGRNVVHHFLFYAVKAGNEPEGFRDCGEGDFKTGWSPLFGAGAGQSTLSFPEGVAQDIVLGSQLLVSLHLLNVSDKPITDTAEVVMTRTHEGDAIPVQMGIMGNSQIKLPPKEARDIVAERSIRSDLRLLGLWAHMHLLGTSMKLEVGPTKDSMKVFYERAPYDFHNQNIDSMDVVIPAGSYSRLTCSYFNTTNETVTYGESSFNEMCFLLMFSAGRGGGTAFPGF